MRLAGLALLLAATLGLAPAGLVPALAGDSADKRNAAGDRSPGPKPVDSIRLATAVGHVSVDCVVVIAGDGVYAAATEGAVLREPISTRLPEFIPLLGPLFEKGPRVRDFTPTNRAGALYLSGRTLILRPDKAPVPGSMTGAATLPADLCQPGGGALSVPATTIGGPVEALAVVVVNGQLAFAIRTLSFHRAGPAAPLLTLPFGTADLPEIGHAHAEGRELMLVVSPSVLE